jgi:hypothetical protein
MVCRVNDFNWGRTAIISSIPVGEPRARSGPWYLTFQPRAGHRVAVGLKQDGVKRGKPA